MLGRIKSTRQVTNRPTFMDLPRESGSARIPASAFSAPAHTLFFTRPTLGAYLRTREELLGRANEILGWVAAGKLKARIDREFKLADAPSAHIALNSRDTMGKVLLIP